MKTTTYRCDLCGRVKGESNHWWLLTRSDYSIILMPWKEDGEERLQHEFDLCGHDCVQRKISELLMFKGKS